MSNLMGQLTRDFNRLDAAESALKEKVDNLAKMHEKIPSIDYYRSEIDNFIRRKGENRAGNGKATTLIHKLRPIFTKGG